MLGISTDTRAAQAAYSASLGNIPYPILSDFYPHGQVANLFGIFNEENGASRRAVIIVDKQGIVRFKRVYASAADLDMTEVLAEVDKL